MIKTNINKRFPHHLNHYNVTDKSIYVADYSEKTKNMPVKKGVEIFTGIFPTDIKYFSLQNNVALSITSIIFNDRSFIYPNGNTRSQCECVIFPESSNTTSWILFSELKYSTKKKRNKHNLKKAILQLYKTRTYYYQRGVFSKTNTCYLLASLPMQREPFANFSISQTMLRALKRKHNTVLRLQNNAEISNSTIILV